MTPEEVVARRVAEFGGAVLGACILAAVTDWQGAVIGAAICGVLQCRWLLAIDALGGDAARYQKDQEFWSKRHPAWEQRSIAWTTGIGALALITLAALLGNR
jgi:hypothetical protein